MPVCNKTLIHSFIPPLLTEFLFWVQYCARAGTQGFTVASDFSCPLYYFCEVAVRAFPGRDGTGASKSKIETGQRVALLGEIKMGDIMSESAC
jgi:hypothetical protein